MNTTPKNQAERHVTVLEKKPLFAGFHSVEQLTVQHSLPGGGLSPALVREVVHIPEAVMVLLFDLKRQAVVLVEQFRAAALTKRPDWPWLLELPAGIVEPGHTPEETAAKEAFEETGLTPERLKLVHRYYTTPGASTQIISLFVGEVDSSKAHTHAGVAGEGEYLTVHVASMDEAVDHMEAGRIADASSLIGLQWLLLNQTMQRLVAMQGAL